MRAEAGHDGHDIFWFIRQQSKNTHETIGKLIMWRNKYLGKPLPSKTYLHSQRLF